MKGAPLSQKKRVGVVRGGPSAEYDVSLKTGARVLSLTIPGIEWKDILIDKHGMWYLNGVAQKPSTIFRNIDGIFNALHGTYGEDGSIQEILDTFAVPYTGSGRMASALAMRKDLSGKRCADSGIQVPFSLCVREGDAHTAVFHFVDRFPAPWVVKPAGTGSSVGVSLVYDKSELVNALEHAFEYGSAVLVEEYIEGKEATCGVIEGVRGEDLYPLFPVEIIPRDASFFDYSAKYEGGTTERCPGNFSEEEKLKLQELALSAHQCLGLRHYSRSDFIIHPDRGIFLLEVNALPGLTEGSLLPLELDAAGISFEEFIESLVRRAI